MEAMKPYTEPGAEKWLKLNADYAKTWPNITLKRDPPPDLKEWEGKPDKLNISAEIQAKVTSTRRRVLKLSFVNGPPRSLMNTTSNRSRKGSPTFAATWAVHISRECQSS